MKNINHEVGSDPLLSLEDLKHKVEEWISLYGKDAIFTTDAGYNNVSLMIDTRLKTIKDYKKQNDQTCD